MRENCARIIRPTQSLNQPTHSCHIIPVFPIASFSNTQFSAIVQGQRVIYWPLSGERGRKGCKQMDPFTSAIFAALSAGATSGITEASKMAVTDAYQTLKGLLTRKF